MSTSEKFKRMNAMRERIRRYNVYRWADDFMDRLRDVKREQQKLRARVITPEVATRIVSDFARSSSRLLLLDYDGTLVPLAESPDRASPDPELLSLLARLSAIENTEVVIISGRDRESLDRWFGDIDINLVAEHGAWIKMRGKSWEPIEPLRKEWKKEIRRILEVYVDRTPGSFIEEKEYSIAWHYRKVQAELGEVRAKELKDILLSLVASHKLEVLEGDKVIEIRIAGIGKGKAALKFLRMRSWSFILAAGDDWTDEEMFAVLPPEAYT
ncbi:MAG: trehalose-phosphatase, partial [Crenarchaeota archaeon]|nr:trehalose-phosphatase [Thermoproteota archaeon]